MVKKVLIFNPSFSLKRNSNSCSPMNSLNITCRYGDKYDYPYQNTVKPLNKIYIIYATIFELSDVLYKIYSSPRRCDFSVRRLIKEENETLDQKIKSLPLPFCMYGRSGINYFKYIIGSGITKIDHANKEIYTHNPKKYFKNLKSKGVI